jgi:hypothetical protein
MLRWTTCGAALCLLVLTLLVPSLARAREVGGENPDDELRAMLRAWLESKAATARPPECEKNCYVLASMSLTGAVGEPLAFDLKGTVLVDGPTKVPLFGPPDQVRLDNVLLDGAPSVVGFEDDHFFALVTGPRSFELRGLLTLSNDEILTVMGPLDALDAKLRSGRLVEGERLSGLASTTIHFDPMTPESQSEAESKTPKVFRLSRAVRIGKETGFVYRLVLSQATEIGMVHLPLSLGEKVREVSGAPGWTADTRELLLPMAGKSGDVTITGVLAASAAKDGVRSFGVDERSAYEWWLVESDPDFRVELGGEGKLVDNSQSPIGATMPNARTFLIQRGEHLEVAATSLIRGEVLAAVARTQKRFVSLTGRGDVIGDESIAYENNGLDHLTLTPPGQPMYVSTDGQPGRVLHTQVGSADLLVPLLVGVHQLRVQTLSQARLWPFVGVFSVPMSEYPLTTSTVEVTVGLPADVHPLAMFGGDHPLWALTRADFIAALLATLGASFAFRTNRTRLLGSVATVGLWLVSRDVFVVVTACLFFASIVFLASRFLRGNWLLSASATAFLISLFTARAVLSGDVIDEPRREFLVQAVQLPQPESSHANAASRGSLDTMTGVTPVSLSTPTSERYVRTSRQLVTSKRPFVPRIVYATETVWVGFEIAWLGVLGMLIVAHRAKLALLLELLKERLSRRPATSPEIFPDF